MLDVEATSTSANMLHPETLFGCGSDEERLCRAKLMPAEQEELNQKNYRKLSILFRRYSRCDDILKSTEDHAIAIKEKFNEIMMRGLNRPGLLEHLRKKAWAFGELSYQTKNGKPSSIDIGLNDNSIVMQALKDLREQVQAGLIRLPAPMKRDLDHV